MKLATNEPKSKLLLSKLEGKILSLAVSIAKAIETRLDQVFDEYPVKFGEIEFVREFSSRVSVMNEYYFVQNIRAETAYISDAEDFLFYRSLEKDFMKPGTYRGEVKGLYDLIPTADMREFRYQSTWTPPKKLARFYKTEKDMFTIAKLFIAERIKEKYRLCNNLLLYRNSKGNLVLLDDDLRSMRRRNVKKSM